MNVTEPSTLQILALLARMATAIDEMHERLDRVEADADDAREAVAAQGRLLKEHGITHDPLGE